MGQSGSFHSRLLASTLVFLFFAQAASAGEIKKCVDDDGNVTFSDTGCSSGVADSSSVDVELDYQPTRTPSAASNQIPSSRRAYSGPSKAPGSEPRTMTREQYYSPTEQWKRIQQMKKLDRQMEELDRQKQHAKRMRSIKEEEARSMRDLYDTLNEVNKDNAKIREEMRQEGFLPDPVDQARAKCDYYKASIREYENIVMRGGKTREERLSNESHLETLRSLKARTCK